MATTSTLPAVNPDDTNQTLIFVYGSLKNGYALHYLLTGQKCLGTAVTKPLYRLFDLGTYPGMVEWPAGLSVTGEVYQVDRICLEQLDEAEGTADGLYARRPVQLEPPLDSTMVYAWFWLQSVTGKVDCRSIWPQST
jgi:gamma-glutamylaminecyclotransferase